MALRVSRRCGVSCLQASCEAKECLIKSNTLAMPQSFWIILLRHAPKHRGLLHTVIRTKTESDDSSLPSPPITPPYAPCCSSPSPSLNAYNSHRALLKLHNTHSVKCSLFPSSHPVPRSHHTISCKSIRYGEYDMLIKLMLLIGFPEEIKS